jgi:hypothetical protein
MVEYALNKNIKIAGLPLAEIESSAEVLSNPII